MPKESAHINSYLPTEYSDLGIDARWLQSDKASNAYSFVTTFCRADYYAIDKAKVEQYSEHKISNHSIAKRWVSSLVSTEGTVQIIYGEDEVVIISAKDFIDRWQDIFCPGRDDAVVLHNLTKVILYYCHEEEWTYGQRP